MKYIKKGVEPESLTHHRCKSHADYDNYDKKDDLRNALLMEQGHICCYCMQRIKIRKMKIEHWKPQADFKSLQLNYKNLLGACLGGKGQPLHLQHCDTGKGKELITINPTDKNCETFIKFSSSGEIYSDNENVDRDIDKTLNLNMQTIKKNREAALDEALELLRKEHPGRWTKDILNREIRRWSSRQRAYKPYCQIVVLYLKKRLARCV
ncbi:MAG: TIGR02646 family protein [Deltaproteobacteria bacterium]|nr:MAG: TIGR02646 family protein [Deltaproteobacteria bacterium]